MYCIVPATCGWFHHRFPALLISRLTLPVCAGVIVVGPSGTGKSTLWTVLKAAYAIIQKKLSVHVLNPKSMPRQQVSPMPNIILQTHAPYGYFSGF